MPETAKASLQKLLGKNNNNESRNSYLGNFISLTLFSIGLTNSYSKITNKYQLNQKYKISIDFKINM